ncbi:MAG TPA: hypothetical protein DIW23_10800 [Anaerolineae bacterium]|nr:hypothetical protein [Anaerolineae bacterium]
MKNFKTIIEISFSALFVLTAVFALIFFNFERKAFKAETYQKVFESQDFYNRIPTLLAETMILSSSNAEQLPLTMQGMSGQAWEDFFRTLLPPESLKAVGDSVLNSVFSYLNQESDSVTISLQPIKTNMGTDLGTQAVLNLLKTQPACTLEQVTQMTFSLLTSQEIAFCNPPDELVPLLTPVIQIQLQTMALIIPNELTLVSAENTQTDPRQGIQITRILMRFSPLVPLGFLILLTIATASSLQNWLKWWGLSFLATGFVSIFIGIIGAPIIGLILNWLIRRASSALPNIIASYAGELGSALAGSILLPILLQGVAILLFGAGMSTAWFLIRQRNK